MESRLIEDIKSKINQREEERNKLINKQKIVSGQISFSNTNVRHIAVLKEMLEIPENKELIADEPDGSITIPRTRIKIYDESVKNIKQPRNLYLYAYSIRITRNKNNSIKDYYQHIIEKVYDYDYSEKDLVSKTFINFEKPSISTNVIVENLNSFEKQTFILIPKYSEGSSNNYEYPWVIRREYIHELITNGQESADNIIKKYYYILDEDYVRSHK